MTRVLLLQLIAALAFVLAVAGPEVAMTFEPPQALSDARLTGGELAPPARRDHNAPGAASVARAGRTTVTVHGASAATLAETLPSKFRSSEFCRAPIRI